MPDIDFGQLSEALNDKSDRDLRNVDTTAKADAVIDFQLPTAENNYTWYRKYKSGWVEQGGYVETTSIITVTFPVVMTDNNYSIFTTGQSSGSSKPSDTNTPNKNTVYTYAKIIYNKTTTGFGIVNTNEMNQNGFSWQVSGIAA